MRIVAGRFKRRSIEAPAGKAVRPTSERARQALFNTLEHGEWGVRLAGARVLDAFAGTGALGLEALSRGAAHVAFLENDRAALAALRRNIQSLGVGRETSLIERDATRPGAAAQAVDLAFLDPPYGSGLAAPALVALKDGGWLHRGSLAVVELAKRDDLEVPAGFTVIEERRYGAAKLLFLGLTEAGSDRPAQPITSLT